MIVCYDETVDILRVVLSDSKVVESDNASYGFILDYDEVGDPVAIEILDASRRVANPRSVEFRLHT